MAKGVIVVNKIPPSCRNCRFCCNFGTEDSHPDICIAIPLGRLLSDIPIDSKPNWCPINPLPEKKEPTAGSLSPLLDIWYSEYSKGYNECLKEIIGEE